MHSTAVANLTYLASPKTNFHGCQIFNLDPRNANIFASKDKLNCTMKKCMVSMATVNLILENGGVHTKSTISPLLVILD